MGNPMPKYDEAKKILGRRPTRTEFFRRLRDGSRSYLKHGWLSFLASVGDVTQEEQSWVGRPVEDFLFYLEKTRFEKAYKIPAVLAFLRDGGMRSGVTLTEIGQSFMDFYREDETRQSDFCNQSNRDWEKWGVNEFADLAWRNPVRFLSREFFQFDEATQIFSLDPKLGPFLSPALAAHVRDIMEFRELRYFWRVRERDRFFEDEAAAGWGN